MSAAYNWEEIEKRLRESLQPKRYAHTLGVTYTACALAMCHGADMTAARVAGLLHDCAKCLPDEEKIRLVRDAGEEINEVEERYPGLLHAKAGAVLAARDHGIADPTILQAIRRHTTGAPDMSLLDKIVYVADYIEPHRHRAPNLDILRRMAFHDLDNCLLVIMEQTVTHLAEKREDKNAIDPETLRAVEFYREQLEKRNKR